ncbi:MAG: (Fe-S)-binding protein [Anaerolineae bacterium]
MNENTYCPPGEICRPTFWNIPEWLQITLYILALVAVALFFYGVWRQHIQYWRRGKGEFKLDQLSKRILNFLTFGVATKKVATENQPAGVMHLGLMWGMIILFIGTALATVDWDVTRLLFSWRLLRDGFYFLYKTVLDLFGVIALLSLAVALFIRYVQRPRRLWGYDDGKMHLLDDTWVVGSFTFFVITGFMLESLRFAATHPPSMVYSPFGALLSNLWVPLGAGAISAIHLGVWLLHAGVTLCWIVYLPYTKFFHIFASSTNTLFKPLTPPNAIPAIQNIEEQETFGVGKFEEFSWKRLMDFDACTRCGRCQARCPASLTFKALSPKMIEVKLNEYGRHLTAEPKTLVGETINPQELWDCTTCMQCVEACPVGINQLDAILDMRRYLTLSEGAPQPPSNKTMDSMERQGNPYGLPRAARWDAIKDLGVEFAEPDKEYEILYWVGCAGAYDQRNQKITRAMIRILQNAQVPFAIMQEERCNCESARRLGNEYLYQMATMENVENLKALKFKRILTQCPHCLNTLKNEYPQFEGQFQVVHHAQYIQELLVQARIKVRPAVQARITYHDSCYLGRYNGIYDPQREILTALGADGHYVEMARSRNNGLCCGGGGGRMWLEENTGTRINQLRIQDVLDVQAKTVASACPFCMAMLDDGAKAKGVDEQVTRKDIAELVAEALLDNKQPA